MRYDIRDPELQKVLNSVVLKAADFDIELRADQENMFLVIMWENSGFTPIAYAGIDERELAAIDICVELHNEDLLVRLHNGEIDEEDIEILEEEFGYGGKVFVGDSHDFYDAYKAGELDEIVKAYEKYNSAGNFYRDFIEQYEIDLEEEEL